MRETGGRQAPPRGRAGRVLAQLALGVVVTLIGAGLSAGATVIASTAPPPVGVSTTPVDLGIAGETASIAWPDGVSAAAFDVEGVDDASGATGAESALPIASIAKLVTMLVVLDRAPLEQGAQGPTLTMGEADLALRSAAVRRGAAVMPMTLGQQLTQRQLLDAAMLQSSANAATTLAQWVFGSQETYIGAATAWLAAHDLGGIQIADATGLSRRNVATASDLLRLMELVDGEPVLRQITGQRQAVVPGMGVVANTNGSLGLAGIDSGKTGSLRASGRTVLVGATTSVAGIELRIHAALLGVQDGVDRDAAIASLVASVAEHVVEREVVVERAPVATYEAPWGAVLRLHARSMLAVVV